MNSISTTAERESAGANAGQLLAQRTLANAGSLFHLLLLGVGVLVGVLYASAFREMWCIWGLTDSYYSHGYLVGPISLFFVWRARGELLSLPLRPSPPWGYLGILSASFLLLMSDFLGFGVFGQLSLLPMIGGLVCLFLGIQHLRLLWFPIAFLFFMVPIPPSITASIAVQMKFFATAGAVALAKAMFLPLVQEGSYVVFGNDRLLVGDVCGGLRSLIALLALGALMSYISRGRPWARVALLCMAPPIAIATNILRIFALCAIAYHYGSPAATGWVHDISGFMIFVVALFLFFSCDVLFVWLSRRGWRDQQIDGGDGA